MKIAYIILAHKDPLQVVRLIDRLNCNNTIFLIHYDKNSNDKDYDYLKKRLNDYKDTYFAKRQKYLWAEFPALSVSFNCLKELFNLNIDFHYALLISGQHYPIKTNRQIFDFFLENKGKSVLIFRKIPNIHIPPNSTVDWIKRWVFTSKSADKKIFFPRSYPSIFRRKFPKRFVPYWNNMWWALTRKCILDLLGSTKSNPELYKYMKHNLAPEEIFYSTAILNIEKYKNKLLNKKLVYERWIPVTFGNSSFLDMRDLTKIKKSDFLFARKFDFNYSRKLMDKIDSELLN